MSLAELWECCYKRHKRPSCLRLLFCC